MSDLEKFYPAETNIGKDCQYWGLGATVVNCCFPKFELQGRTTCQGIIDDVCMRVKNGRTASNFTEMLMKGSNLGVPDSFLLPPGEID